MEKDKPLDIFGNSNKSDVLSVEDPSPANVEEFIPWAVLKMGLAIDRVNINKKCLIVPVARGKKSQKDVKGEKPLDLSLKQVKESSSSKGSLEEMAHKNEINIVLTYQASDLVHILFEKTKRLPREILQIIELILEFNPSLYGVTINCGIDKYTIYELNKFLAKSNITEICLDDTFVREANYALLLNDPSCLQVLSLARCKIGDKVVEEIAEKLHYPLPASQKLVSLNLSSNSLTDKSAVYLATALRSNRKLIYLNVASNLISDKGGEALLNTFTPFPLTLKEQISWRHRYIDYLMRKKTLIEEYVADIKTGGDKKGAVVKKDKKFNNQFKKKDELTENLAESILYEKAETIVQSNLGEFEDPMNDSFLEGDWRYLRGNTTLMYLNIAYNHLSYCFLKLLVKVMQYQQSGQKARGLMNIRLEGNPIPRSCAELIQTDDFIESYLQNSSLLKRRQSVHKKAK